MNMKSIGSLTLAIIMLVASSAAALALPNVEWVKINEDRYEDGDDLVVERGEELDFRIKLTNDGESTEKDIQVELDLLGYEYNDVNQISDTTSTFDLGDGETRTKSLSITMPDDAEARSGQDYDLRVRVGGRTGPSHEFLFRITLKSPRHLLKIEDVIFSPENSVVAGRALLATLRIENIGAKDEESLKVKLSIPSLGISATDYVDELDEDDSVTSEELFLRIPSCTPAGIYTAVASVTYDEGYETVKKERSVRVLADEACTLNGEDTGKKPTEKTVINVGAPNQNVVVGTSGAVYPITISNMGSQSRIYTVNVDGTADWATTKVTPSSAVIVGSGETKAIYVYVTAAQNAAAGEHMFSVKLDADGKDLKEIPLKATVAASEDGASVSGSPAWERVKRGLEIGLIVLVVLLILLALIVGFNKLRGDKEEDSQTYY